MPDAWSDKRERQYQHIKKNQQQRYGKSEERAKEIAARTVNEERRRKGETKGETKGDPQRTEGTGNPNSSLESRTKAQLYNRAAELDIDGRSEMSKQELVEAIRAAE